MVLFTCDHMLGKLATWLRLAGYDTLYVNDPHFMELNRSLREERIYLTRNNLLVKRRIFSRFGLKYYLVKSLNRDEQLKEVLNVFGLRPGKNSFCPRCNLKTVPVDTGSVAGRVPEYVFKTIKEFSTCTKCRRIYWKGTHYAHFKRIFKSAVVK